MRTMWALPLAAILLIPALLANAETVPTDADADGAIDSNVSPEEVDVIESVVDNSHLEDVECILLAATDNEPSKQRLDTAINVQCNDYTSEIWGDCNCPSSETCGMDGTTEDVAYYYCRIPDELDEIDPEHQEFGDGLLLGELEEPQVIIANAQ